MLHQLRSVSGEVLAIENSECLLQRLNLFFAALVNAMGNTGGMLSPPSNHASNSITRAEETLGAEIDMPPSLRHASSPVHNIS